MKGFGELTACMSAPLCGGLAWQTTDIQKRASALCLSLVLLLKILSLILQLPIPSIKSIMSGAHLTWKLWKKKTSTNTRLKHELNVFNSCRGTRVVILFQYCWVLPIGVTQSLIYSTNINNKNALMIQYQRPHAFTPDLLL
ncbi:hypothetical protein BDV97DRAFT_62304 [Delphinella strobiligena]|nr:hypothetical protein BDV97DRAFT_62304 [Delphinella strobiligena]